MKAGTSNLPITGSRKQESEESPVSAKLLRAFVISSLGMKRSINRVIGSNIFVVYVNHSSHCRRYCDILDHVMTIPQWCDDITTCMVRRFTSSLYKKWFLLVRRVIRPRLLIKSNYLLLFSQLYHQKMQQFSKFVSKLREIIQSSAAPEHISRDDQSNVFRLRCFSSRKFWAIGKDRGSEKFATARVYLFLTLNGDEEY